MTVTTKIALASFAGLIGFVGIDRVQAQWTGGPVLIGGDDADDHFLDPVTNLPTGRAYMREGFSFLGAQVTNGDAVVVCLGDNGDRR